MNYLIIVSLLLMCNGMQQKTPALEHRLIGTWHGTSVCVDHKTDTACKDEEVIYVITAVPSARDTVEMEAFKIVNNKHLSMGVLRLTYSHASDAWAFELATRVRALWTFQANDSTMEGTLVELPTKRLIRKVHANRVSE